MTDYVIETEQLSKSYKEKAALRGLDLRVPAGSIFGFLGRNGAGKTTTIKTLMGLLRADSGRARVFGLPVEEAASATAIRRRIGFVTEDKELYPYMTVEEIIRFTRGFFPGWREDLQRRYVEMFDLPLKGKIPELSKGMRSKLMLLLATCRGADLLILDEPTDGLDPAAIEDVLRELVSIAAETGTTMFFSSHQLPEVDLIADHIGIIDGGRMVMAGSLDDIKASYQQLRVVMEEPRQTAVRWGDGVESVKQDGRVVTLLVSRNAEAIAAQAQELPGAVVERFPATLKEIFLEHVRSN